MSKQKGTLMGVFLFFALLLVPSLPTQAAKTYSYHYYKPLLEAPEFDQVRRIIYVK